MRRLLFNRWSDVRYYAWKWAGVRLPFYAFGFDFPPSTQPDK